MGEEIERKFLVKAEGDWRHTHGLVYRQGYLNTAKERTVRVRTVADKGMVTIKGETVGASRLEFEYEIPLQDANEMLDKLCLRPLIEKTRRKIEHEGLVWEVDEFYGDNSGLVLAEVELEDEKQSVAKPAWVGREVTADPRYYNANLVTHPYSKWKEQS